MKLEEAQTFYMWFKLYQGDIKSDSAKWDFLNHIRKSIALDPWHEEFYQKYGKDHNLI
jgi:hypothetical protein